MTIDEAIEELKSENGYYANNGMTDVAEFNTKIIRWLEELKSLRNGLNIKCDNLNEALENSKKIGYNKAIDDFAEKLKARSIKVSTVKDHTYLKAVGTNEIDKIAQQMKEGVRV